MIAAPSAPAAADHSAAMVAPMSASSAARRCPGTCTLMPLAASVADMEGIRFRAYNDATARLAALAGMPAVQVEAAALREALADGRAEAFISSGATGYDRQVWDHVSHFYDARTWVPRNYVFANKAAFEALNGQAQNCLRATALLAEAACTARARALTDWYLTQLSIARLTYNSWGGQGTE